MKLQQQTTKIFVDTLKEMGCPYEIGCNHVITFLFRNNLFIAIPYAESPEVIVVDRDREAIDLEDLDKVLKTRKAINEVNQQTTVTTFYTIDEEEKVMRVFGKYLFYFSSCIANKKSYLRDIFDGLIDAHLSLTVEMEFQG